MDRQGGHPWIFMLIWQATLLRIGESLTPRHQSFIDAILQTPCHVICNLRTKVEYVLVEKNGKQVPEKVGMKSETRENLDYEMTVVFSLDIK